MKLFRFVVVGDPVGKQRPRVAGGHAYTPQKTRDYEILIQDNFMIQLGKNHYFTPDEPVYVHVDITLPVPKSASKAQREKMLNGEILPMVKPDGDNVLKSVLDALEGYAYSNDKQVIDQRSRKKYGEQGMITVWLSNQPIEKFFMEDANE
jgi:Holliday junction resolvase RusA-like endonuclease